MKDDPDRYPVPHPDGQPFPARELEAAQARMLDTMRGPAPDHAPLEGDRGMARAALDEPNARQVDDDAAKGSDQAPVEV